ncbi:hypothetical protein SCAR479_13044 [Seiridium cardinale]|uniref:Uncharacterized protein n=1 Tax=Seiridium cardinale TaxID=138064 RepID=A0ABR2X957_9PEZI
MDLVLIEMRHIHNGQVCARCHLTLARQVNLNCDTQAALQDQLHWNAQKIYEWKHPEEQVHGIVDLKKTSFRWKMHSPYDAPDTHDFEFGDIPSDAVFRDQLTMLHMRNFKDTILVEFHDPAKPEPVQPGDIMAPVSQCALKRSDSDAGSRCASMPPPRRGPIRAPIGTTMNERASTGQIVPTRSSGSVSNVGPESLDTEAKLWADPESRDTEAESPACPPAKKQRTAKDSLPIIEDSSSRGSYPYRSRRSQRNDKQKQDS